MDDQNQPANLDPDLIINQNIAQTTPSQLSSSVIDITPGSTDADHDPKINSIDHSPIVKSQVLDITPDGSPPSEIEAIDPIVVDKPITNDPPTNMVLEAKTPPSPSPDIQTTGAHFQVDTSSPLYEDPDKLMLPKKYG